MVSPLESLALCRFLRTLRVSKTTIQPKNWPNMKNNIRHLVGPASRVSRAQCKCSLFQFPVNASNSANWPRVKMNTFFLLAQKWFECWICTLIFYFRPRVERCTSEWGLHMQFDFRALIRADKIRDIWYIQAYYRIDPKAIDPIADISNLRTDQSKIYPIF